MLMIIFPCETCILLRVLADISAGIDFNNTSCSARTCAGQTPSAKCGIHALSPYNKSNGCVTAAPAIGELAT